MLADDDDDGLWLSVGLQIAAYSRPLFSAAILTGKVGQTDRSIVLVCDRGSFVRLFVQGYKSLCAAATICSTLVNTRTHTQTDSIGPVYMNS